MSRRAFIGTDGIPCQSEQLGALRSARVPAIFQNREFATAGGLMGYGGNLTDAYRMMGSTPAAFSKARSRPICRSNVDQSGNDINFKTAKASASLCRYRYSAAPTR